MFEVVVVEGCAVLCVGGNSWELWLWWNLISDLVWKCSFKKETGMRFLHSWNSKMLSRSNETNIITRCINWHLFVDWNRSLYVIEMCGFSQEMREEMRWKNVCLHIKQKGRQLYEMCSSTRTVHSNETHIWFHFSLFIFLQFKWYVFCSFQVYFALFYFIYFVVWIFLLALFSLDRKSNQSNILLPFLIFNIWIFCSICNLSFCDLDYTKNSSRTRHHHCWKNWYSNLFIYLFISVIWWWFLNWRIFVWV